MNWLTRFTNNRSTALSIKTALPEASFDGMIRHARWQNAQGTVIEDAYVNPEKDSPISAIIISRNTSANNHHTMTISLVENKGIPNSLARLKESELYGGMYGGLPEDGFTSQGLEGLGIKAPEYVHVILSDMSGESVTEATSQKHFINGLQQIIDTLRNTSVLSSNANIRDAFIETMRSTLTTIRTLPHESSAAKLIGHP